MGSIASLWRKHRLMVWENGVSKGKIIPVALRFVGGVLVSFLPPSIFGVEAASDSVLSSGLPPTGVFRVTLSLLQTPFTEMEPELQACRLLNQVLKDYFTCSDMKYLLQHLAGPGLSAQHNHSL